LAQFEEPVFHRREIFQVRGLTGFTFTYEPDFFAAAAEQVRPLVRQFLAHWKAVVRR